VGVVDVPDHHGVADTPKASARETVRERAREFGFDAVGFAAAAGSQNDTANLRTFIDRGLHGDMAWMADTAERRADPQVLWPEARTIISLGVSYAPAGDPLAITRRGDRGAISVYARGRDYHGILKKRLKALGRWLAETHACEVKVFVDTAPIMEKPVAQRAGVGWTGKHTNLVSRRHGSWLFLGEVFTTLDLEPDPPEADHCGSCDACLRACPTGALPEPYRIDPGRCISYLTIEAKGAIPEDLRSQIGNRVYGCDDCLAVCPWNRFADDRPDDALAARTDLDAPALADLAVLDDAAFRALFAGTAIKRTERDRFSRNVLIAIGNSADADLADVVRSRLDDGSPLVRESARWALGRLTADG